MPCPVKQTRRVRKAIATMLTNRSGIVVKIYSMASVRQAWRKLVGEIYRRSFKVCHIADESIGLVKLGSVPTSLGLALQSTRIVTTD